MCHQSILKKKAMGHFSETLIITTATDVNRSCRCSDFLRGQTLQPNVMNIMVGFLCCLVYSAAQSNIAEQYLSG